MFVYYFKEGMYIQSRIFSYFNTRGPKPNEQPFLNFVIFLQYFCSDLSLLTFFIYYFIVLIWMLAGFSTILPANKADTMC